jgi:hypothetical protein
MNESYHIRHWFAQSIPLLAGWPTRHNRGYGGRIFNFCASWFFRIVFIPRNGKAGSSTAFDHPWADDRTPLGPGLLSPPALVGLRSRWLHAGRRHP